MSAGTYRHDARGRVVTQAGVVIGARYQAPPPAAGSEAERIQHLLLAPRRHAAGWVRALAAGLAAVSITRSKP